MPMPQRHQGTKFQNPVFNLWLSVVNLHSMSQLKVYKASAGSGKTFRLAVEYMKLALTNDSNYRHILAVTFTNKATAEMKSRIIGEL
jgi:superfamily I DNA/RNA helicase